MQIALIVYRTHPVLARGMLELQKSSNLSEGVHGTMKALSLLIQRPRVRFLASAMLRDLSTGHCLENVDPPLPVEVNGFYSFDKNIVVYYPGSVLPPCADAASLFHLLKLQGSIS